MFDYTGSEKAVVALAPAMVPLVTIITALLALAGLGVMPDPAILAQAIAFLFVTIVGSRLVWQVPNTSPEEVKKIEKEEKIEEEEKKEEERKEEEVPVDA